MKKIILTFDDGREDNYLNAFPIMKENGLTGTIFITTGYIDGTWKKPDSWKSAEKPLSIDQIKILKSNGWEIGLHGDKHITEINDTLYAIEKMNSWLNGNYQYGFSLPNSLESNLEIKEFVEKCNIEYIRKGRKNNTRSIKSLINYFIYRFFRSSNAYKRFNNQNINYEKEFNKYCIYSVVIRREDDPNMIVKFIDSLNDDAFVVFMLHSVIDKESSNYNVDPWCWDKLKFNRLCEQIRQRIDENKLISINLEKIMVKNND